MKPKLRLPSSAMVIAIAALFFALGGVTAVAAHKYVITSTRQIKPSVLKKFEGAKSSRGMRGPQGQQGSTGDTGP
jgi:hypothetical protein